MGDNDYLAADHCLLDSKYHKTLFKILGALMNNPASEEFRLPVPWREMGLMDYP